MKELGFEPGQRRRLYFQPLPKSCKTLRFVATINGSIKFDKGFHAFLIVINNIRFL